MILVTGGTGMLGSHLLLELCSKGCKVRAIKRKTSKVENVIKCFSFYRDKKTSAKLFGQIEWVDTDILDFEELEIAMQDIDIIYHAAAFVSFNPSDRKKIISINVQGTANIVNAALKNNVKKLCHVSSIAAINERIDKGLISESTDKIKKEKSSTYSESKFFSEMEVWRGITEGLNAVIVNPSIIIGPGNWEHGSPSMIKTVWKGFKFYTKGENGFVDVRDVAKIMILLTESNINSERFIINSENLPFRKVFDEIAISLDKPKPSIFANNFLMQTARILELIKYKVLGKEPKITKNTISSAKSKRAYSNEKIKKHTDYKFIKIKDAILNACKMFLEEKNN